MLHKSATVAALIAGATSDRASRPRPSGWAGPGCHGRWGVPVSLAVPGREGEEGGGGDTLAGLRTGRTA